jgi:pSer/pThr/pTyr-binding forkhead associated (FHA) protein
MANLIFRHISGSRATEVDIVPIGAHRELILGRAPSAAVRFDPRYDDQVSRHHARIIPVYLDRPGYLLADLGSRNGTFRNGDRVAEPVLLHTGDIVRLGDGGPEVEIVMERDVILESDSPIRS